MNKYHIGAGIVALAIVAYIGYVFPMASAPVQQATGSATGSTFNTAKVAEITMAPISLTSTTTSLLNSDSSDRIIDSSFVSCATSTLQVFGAGGAGLLSWLWQMATTSVANLGLQGNTNYASQITVATSTTDNAYTASSTQPALGNRGRLWPAGSYLSILSVGSTTNSTLTCQAGVYYHGT